MLSHNMLVEQYASNNLPRKEIKKKINANRYLKLIKLFYSSFQCMTFLKNNNKKIYISTSISSLVLIDKKIQGGNNFLSKHMCYLL